MTALNSINTSPPWRLFISPIDYEDILLTIDYMIKECAQKPIHLSTPSDEEEKKQLLEKAYQLALTCLSVNGVRNQDKELAFLLGDIFKQYAQLCYQSSFFATKQLLLMAWNMNLCATGLISQHLDLKDYSSLEDLKNHCLTHPRCLNALEEQFTTSNAEAHTAAVYSNNLVQKSPEKRLFHFGDTLRWLAYCYQQLDAYKAETNENNSRFAFLFSTSESLLLLADTEESLKALSDLYYQGWPFLHERKYPHDTTGIIAEYNKALTCDPSPEMAAKVALSRFFKLIKADRKIEAATYIQQAEKLIKELSDTPANQSLKANIHYGCARYFLDPDTINPEQAETHLELSLAYAKHLRSLGKDHLHFAFYHMRMAELKFILNDYAAAKESIEDAIHTFRRYPGSQQEHLEEAIALQTLIDKTIASTVDPLIAP